MSGTATTDWIKRRQYKNQRNLADTGTIDCTRNTKLYTREIFLALLQQFGLERDRTRTREKCFALLQKTGLGRDKTRTR